MKKMLIFAIALAVIGGCSKNGEGEYRSWQTYESGGVTAKIPGGWDMSTDDNGVIRGRGSAGEEVVVWPVFIPGKLSAKASQKILTTLSGKLYDNVIWNSINDLGNGTFRMTGTRGDNQISACIFLSEKNNRTGGMLYIVSGPREMYRDQEDTFAGILNSIRVRGSLSRGEFEDREVMTYTDYADPREGAFKVKVPRGWNVTGGMDRYASVDVRNWIRAQDPRGDILVFSGDTNIPPYTVPNQMLEWAGFNEGTWYPSGYGVNMYVSRYIPGLNFARNYLSHGGIQGYGNIKVTGQKNRNDVAENLYRVAAGYGIPGLRYDAGELRFTGEKDGKQYNGYIIAVTYLIDTYTGVQTWYVDSISGFIAAQEKEYLAEEVYGEMLSSFEINPAWYRQQQRLTANVSAIVSETSSQIFDIISQSYDYRSKTQDEIIRKYSNYLRGVEDVRDTEYGGEYKVWSGSNYYWLDNSGTVLGTDLHINPDISRFREMVRMD